MKLRVTLTVLLAAVHCAVAAPFSTNGNRLAYLDSDDPFYPGRDFPKLITPQWVGEEGVDAVVILSIDDMRETARYETFLRPILERLKKIDGRAPVSIMANAPAAGRSFSDTNSPDGKQIQSWLKEGLSIECHTISHPCPLCQKGDFQFASTNYHACVDLLNTIPGNKPVAFRMPCCDSMNSPSPRFYSEIFNRTSPQGNFLGIDSSVMVVLTTNDTSLPRELVLDSDGRERFRKYLPTQTNATTRVSMGSFTTTIEDYPYPYVIGKQCWEFPAIVPSDWEANNLHAPNHPKTVEDWQRALDAIVIKQGVMTVVFHPHGWIKPEQMVEFIDYAVMKYGRRVKFLNFKEAQERLNKNLLREQSLRAGSGPDNALRLLDLNNDGFLDVINTLAVTDGVPKRLTHLWQPVSSRWRDFDFPVALMTEGFDRFGVLNTNGQAFIRGSKSYRGFGVNTDDQITNWEFDGEKWRAAILLDLPTNDLSAYKAPRPTDDSERAGWGLAFPQLGMRLRDLDHDGICELVVGNPNFSAVYKLRTNGWRKLDYTLPPNTSIVDAQGLDAGLRLVDVDGDGYDDVLFSNHERYSLHLFRKDARNLRLKPGWSDEIISGLRSNALTDPIPPIVRDGTNRNNGVWFARSTMWIQNEDTAHLPDKVDRRTFKHLLELGNPPPLSPEASLKTMRARPGFKVELVAAEPLIQDPIAFDWSADGRLWVLEMGDYPLGVDGKGSPGGRLRVLTDTDADGRYDSAVTFLDKLSCPEGMHCWRNGAVVIAGKDLFYAEDTNGDGTADVREVLFTGFSEGNQQHRANGFTYGLDGWLYGANGESDGNILPGGVSAQNAKPINIRGQDFRFHPESRQFEAIGGRSQFGLYRDDFGNWFGNNNSTWLWHHSFPVWYLSRNPLLPLKSTKTMLANYPNFTRCFPISKTISRFNDPYAANHVTSGNSPVPYRDELFGKEFTTSIFISEPVHNLVHREVLEADGVSFKSRRAADEANSEFLASSDNWFRPAMLRTGPDGALYVADMYRLVIEHPEWIPAEMQKRFDVRAGTDMGRIYRVFPEGAKLKPIPNLAKLSSAELAAALDSPNGWQRDTAQRLLLERGDKSGVPELESRAKNATDAKVRIQALWTLNRLSALTPELLSVASKDSSDAVKEHAVKLSEGVVGRGFLTAPRHESEGRLENVNASPRRAEDSAPYLALTESLLALVESRLPRLRYQLAFTLGEWSDPRAADALLKLLRDPDANIRNAALSSAPRHATALLALVEKLPADDTLRAHLPMLQKLVANPPASATPLKIVERTITLSPEEKAERAAMLARYAGVPGLRGDAAKGVALFQQHCAQCHRLQGQGMEVGPDLAMMSGKPVEQLVQAILDPNAALEGRYKNYTVTLRDGHETGGIIIAETPTTLTFRTPHRSDETFLRADVQELSTSGQSLMPEGFEAAFTPQQLADLIAFVTGR
jgi:putative membrane-bound dehydrogenase-like protein